MNEFIEINLLPIEDRKIKKDYSFLLDTKVVVPTLGLIFLFIVTNIMASIELNKLEEQQHIVSKLNDDIGNRIIISNNIKKLDHILKEKQAKNNSLKSIRFNKQLWVRILEGVNKALPANSWISSIVQTKENDTVLEIDGSTHLFSEVAQYMIELGKNDFFLNVKLESVSVNPNTDADFFNFTMQINLNMTLGANAPIRTAEKTSL